MEGLWNYTHPGEELPPVDVYLDPDEKFNVTMTAERSGPITPENPLTLRSISPFDDFDEGIQHRARRPR